MRLNQIGKIVAQEWLKSADIRQELRLDAWIIMPNHLHGIVVITNDDVKADSNAHWGAKSDEGASLAPLRDKSPQGRSMQRKPRSLSTFVWGFKSSVTKRIKNICVGNNPCVWQKNYYESIVRNEEQLNNIRQYILDNPQKWDDDPEKPSHQSLELLIELAF